MNTYDIYHVLCVFAFLFRHVTFLGFITFVAAACTPCPLCLGLFPSRHVCFLGCAILAAAACTSNKHSRAEAPLKKQKVDLTEAGAAEMKCSPDAIRRSAKKMVGACYVLLFTTAGYHRVMTNRVCSHLFLPSLLPT